MTVTAQLHDGRVLEFPDGTDPAVVQRTVKKVLGVKDEPAITPEWQKQMLDANIAAGRAEHPVQAKIADVATGMSGSLRGIANLASDGLGDKIWPKAPGSEGTGAKLVGSLLDPVPYVVGGAIGKVAPFAKVGGGQGFLKSAQAVGKNALSGATAGGIIGGLSDEGTAAEGALIGGVLSGGLPAVGALTKWGYNTAKSAIAPATEAGRTAFGQKYFAEVLGPARGKVAAALASPNEIIPGSPTTAADRIAGANVGQTDKFGSALVKAQDVLATQPEKGIADVAKSIAARQEAARAAELGTVAQTPSALATAVAGRKAASKANYRQAFDQPIGPSAEAQAMTRSLGGKVFPDPELVQMAKNPFFQSALKPALRLARAQEQRVGTPTTEIAATSAARKGTVVSGAGKATAATGVDAETASLLKGLGQVVDEDPALKAMMKGLGIGGTSNSSKGISQSALMEQLAKLDTRKLHYLKLALDKKMKRTGDSALSDTEKEAVVALQKQLVSWLGKKNPAYETARAAHEAASRPINQMKVGQDLQRAITAPVSGAERAASFGNALRTAENKVSASTGRTRIADLTPDQLSAVKRVEAELARNAERDALASGVNPKNLFDMAERGKGSFHIPNLLSRPAMVTNWLMGRLGNSADELIAQDVGMMLQKDPAGFAAKYLQDVPVTQRAVVMAAIQQKLRTAAPYTNAAAVSATQNGE